MTAPTDEITVFRPKASKIFVFKSLQVLVVSLVVLVLAIALGPPLSRWDLSMSSPLLLVLLIIAAVAFATARWSRNGTRDYRAEVDSETISVYRMSHLQRNPNPSKEVSKSLRIDEIDRRRSSERTSCDRLLGRHTLYSEEGRSLVLARSLFDPQDFQKLLGMLDIRE